MSVELLAPISEEILSSIGLLPKQIIGKTISIHTEKSGLPEFKNADIALIGVSEIRNSFFPNTQYNLSDFRKAFYQLYPGNWSLTLVDLGDLPNGETVEDTYFALQEICTQLRQTNVIPVIFGGSHDLIYPLYRSFSAGSQLVNLVSIDSQFDFSQQEELISGRSYMSKIIMEQPNLLYNYTNIGYQSYYIAQEELDLMEKLFFESYRLGTFSHDVSFAEPLVREADIVSVDMKALSWQSTADPQGLPNGIDSKTICALARYSGISDRLGIFGLFELPSTPVFHQLLAQIIWYFIEGVSLRFGEYPVLTSQGFKRYTVTLSDRDLVFYQSQVSERWWVEVTNENYLDNKTKTTALLPCNLREYQDACNDILPERWWKATKRG
jgi:hypothetical protein